MAGIRKLKVLCLHGYRQDGETFRQKLGGFRKNIKNIAELTFIDAPNVLPHEDELQQNSEGLSWWFTEENSFKATNQTDTVIGFKDSVDVIKDVFETKGPFDGMLGFSQGASMVSLICGLRETGDFQHDFQFVILVAGFKSIAKCHQHLYNKSFAVESLHIYGKNDQIISKDLSEDLMNKFHSPCVAVHDGGHILPTQSNVKNEYISFLLKMEKIKK